MKKADIQQLLQPLIWDYQIDPYELFEVAVGNKERVGSFTQEKVLLRMLERLSWYDLVKLFGIDGLTKLLTKEIIAQLRFQELRERYELVRKVLQGQAVSFSGWSPEYRQKIQHTLLSNRWYRSQQEIF